MVQIGQTPPADGSQQDQIRFALSIFNERLVVGTLCGVTTLTWLAIAWLAIKSEEVPSILSALAGSSFGAMVTLLGIKITKS
jgi:hypothetical protein